MAKPVTVFPRLRSEREELMLKLSDAPIEHAAALLDLYEFAQVLHDRGTLELLRGLAGASDDIIGRLAAGLSKPESVQALRDFVELTKLFARLDPEKLQSMVNQGTEFLSSAPVTLAEPPGTWAIIRRMTTRDARRALSFFAEALNLIGQRLSPQAGPREVRRTEKNL